MILWEEKCWNWNLKDLAEGMIAGAIKTCKKFKLDQKAAIENVMKQFSLSEKDAINYVKKYW